MHKRIISILILFILILSNTISVFASGNNVHFLRSRVDKDNKTIRIDIVSSTEPQRNTKNHTEAEYGDFSFLKTDSDMKFTIPDQPLYHANFSQSKRDFNGVTFPDGSPIRLDKRGIVEYAGSGKNFTFSFPYNGETSISKKEKTFAKNVESEMNKSIGKITSLLEFKDEDTFLYFWSKFVETNERKGSIELGSIYPIYNYYIGDPNGTTYNKEEYNQSLKSKSKEFYHPDKDQNGNILMYIWTGNKSLDEMGDMDYVDVTSVTYAIPSLYNTNDSIFLINNDEKENITEYYTLRMFVMQALMNYRLKYTTVQVSSYVEVKEDKFSIKKMIGDAITDFINGLTNGITGLFNSLEIVTYRFLTNKFFSYVNPFLGFSALFVIIVTIIAIAFKWGGISLASKSSNPNKKSIIQQSISQIVTYVLTSVLPLAFFNFTIFFSRSMGLVIYDIMPGFDIFALGTADTFGQALGQLVYAIIFSGISFFQFIVILFTIGLIIITPYLLVPNLINGKSDYMHLLKIIGYLLFAPVSMFIVNMMMGLAGTFTIVPLIAGIASLIVSILLINFTIQYWDLGGILGIKSGLSKTIKFGEKLATGAGTAIAGGGVGAIAKGSGLSYGSQSGNSAGVKSGAPISVSSDLDQALSANSNNLGARQAMERGEQTGVFGSVKNTFNEAKDSIGREYESNMESLRTISEKSGIKLNPDSSLSKGLAGVTMGAKIAGKGVGKAIGATPSILSGGLRTIGGAMNATAGILDGDAGTFGRGLSQMGEVGREIKDGIASGIHGAIDYVGHANASQEFKKHISPVSEGGNSGIEGTASSTHDPELSFTNINMSKVRNQGLTNISKNNDGNTVLEYDYKQATPENKRLLDEIGNYQLNGKHQVLKDMGIRSVIFDDKTEKVSGIEMSNANKVLSHMGMTKMEYNSKTDQVNIGRNLNNPTPISYVPKIPNDPPATEVNNEPDYIPPVNKYNYRQIGTRPENKAIGSIPRDPSIEPIPVTPIINSPRSNPLNDLKPISELKATSKITTVKTPNFNKRAN